LVEPSFGKKKTTAQKLPKIEKKIQKMKHKKKDRNPSLFERDSFDSKKKKNFIRKTRSYTNAKKI
jgi:hypothetical protein